MTYHKYGVVKSTALAEGPRQGLGLDRISGRSSCHVGFDIARLRYIQSCTLVAVLD